MSVFYKFASQKEHDVCKVDGHSISVFDLKREIIIAKRLGKGTDFDLALYNAQTNEEYANDSHAIPRGTSIIVRRLPASKPGKGTAQRYLEGGGGGAGGGIPARGSAAGGGRSEFPKDANAGKGRGNVSVSFVDRPHEQQLKSLQASSTTTAPNAGPEDDSEEARIANMFRQTQELWDKQQEEMSHHRPIYSNVRGRGRGRGGGEGRGAHHGSSGKEGGNHQNQFSYQYPLDRPLPPNYVCYRCGQKGHHITQCPTNADPDFDKPRLKKTTGIPRCFLKTVESTDGTGGVMVTPDGGLVVATANDQAWEKLRASSGISGGAYDFMSQVPVIPELKCTLCDGLLREAVYTACCQMGYCDECIRKHLLERDFKCPSCHKKEQLLDTLTPDEELRQKVDDHIRHHLGAAAPKRKSPVASPKPPTSDGSTKPDDEKKPDSTEATEKQDEKVQEQQQSPTTEKSKAEEKEESRKEENGNDISEETISRENGRDHDNNNDEEERNNFNVQQQQQQQASEFQFFAAAAAAAAAANVPPFGFPFPPHMPPPFWDAPGPGHLGMGMGLGMWPGMQGMPQMGRGRGGWGGQPPMGMMGMDVMGMMGGGMGMGMGMNRPMMRPNGSGMMGMGGQNFGPAFPNQIPFRPYQQQPPPRPLMQMQHQYPNQIRRPPPQQQHAPPPHVAGQKRPAEDQNRDTGVQRVRME